MKIICKNPGVKWIFNKKISSDRIEFDDSGQATVSDDIGKELIQFYPDIAKVKSPKAKDKEE